MQMKAGYVWILLLLATTACSTPQEQQGKSESESAMPLSVAQRAEEDARSVVTRPVAFTQVERELYERITGKKNIAAKSEPASPDIQGELIRLMIGVKSHLNKTKQQYKQALGEEEKQWEKRKNDFFLKQQQLKQQQWWKSLTPEQKEHWYESESQSESQQEQVHLKQQNKILKAWGEDIARMTRFMEEEGVIIATRQEVQAEAEKAHLRGIMQKPPESN